MQVPHSRELLLTLQHTCLQTSSGLATATVDLMVAQLQLQAAEGQIAIMWQH